MKFLISFLFCMIIFSREHSLLADPLLDKSIIVNEETRHFYISGKKLLRKKYHLFIFFHGLEHKGVISQTTLKQLEQMEKQGAKHDFLFVFPIGLKGGFPQNPESLAWGPDNKNRNNLFIQNLINALKKEYQIDLILVGGFSNCAYFAYDFLMQNHQKE